MPQVSKGYRAKDPDTGKFLTWEQWKDKFVLNPIRDQRLNLRESSHLADVEGRRFMRLKVRWNPHTDQPVPKNRVKRGGLR